MSLRPKPEIENVEPGTHGGIDYAELASLGIDPKTVLDFSVCINPFMPPPGIDKAFKDMAIDQYPDSESTEFRQRLSEKLEISVENIIAGNGTTELIRIAVLTYFKREDPVLILEPTYGDYEVACNIVGARLIKQYAAASDNFTPNIEETINLIKQHRPRGVFICNPNNPTGRYLSRKDIEAILDTLMDGLLILDEAYLNFVEDKWSSIYLSARDNIVILRSLTKDFALAGIRIAYAIANREIISSMRRVCPPWNVNIIAQKIGAMVLDNEDYLEQTRKQIEEAKKYLMDSLSQRGYPVMPSDANFFLVQAGDAGKLRSALLTHGILVRDCTSFGLPEYIRLAPRTIPECQRLINAIDAILKSGDAMENM